MYWSFCITPLLWPLLTQMNPSNYSNITGFYSQVLEGIALPNPRRIGSRKVGGKTRRVASPCCPWAGFMELTFCSRDSLYWWIVVREEGPPAQPRTQTTKFSLNDRRPLAHGKRNASPFWQSCNPRWSPLRKAESSESAARAVRGIDCGQHNPSNHGGLSIKSSISCWT